MKAMQYPSRYDRQSIFAMVRLTGKSAIPTEHWTRQFDFGSRIWLASLQAIIHKETPKTESHHPLKAMLVTVFVLQILSEHCSDSHTSRNLCLRPLSIVQYTTTMHIFMDDNKDHVLEYLNNALVSLIRSRQLGLLEISDRPIPSSTLPTQRHHAFSYAERLLQR